MTEMQLNAREQPRVDDLGFDARLMSAEQLLRLAGRHPMRLSEQGLPDVFLDCCDDGRAVEVLTDKHGGCYTITALQLLSNVLRHLVLRHELPLSALSGGENGGEQPGRPGPGRGSDAGRSVHTGQRGGSGPGPRPGHQKADHRRVAGAAGDGHQ